MDLGWRRSRRHSREWLNDRIGPIVASELESFGVQASNYAFGRHVLHETTRTRTRRCLNEGRKSWGGLEQFPSDCFGLTSL